MSYLPAPLDDGGLSARQLVKASQAQASSALDVFRYGLVVRAQAQKDEIDSQAVADASAAAFSEEARLLKSALELAGESAALAAIAGRHVERVATINDRRITRRFGG